jgi:CIC family chloride channel protein
VADFGGYSWHYCGLWCFGILLQYKACRMVFLHYLLGSVLPLPKGEGLSEVFVIKRTFLIPFVVALGGLISGFLIFKFADV